MQLVEQTQLGKVEDPHLAMTAVVRPILTGILYGIQQGIAKQLGGYEKITLSLLARTYRPGDGDVGICFEYAVHQALQTGLPDIKDRIDDAVKKCKVSGSDITSILFGAEKSGSQQIIDTAKDVLTDYSDLLYGKRGRPLKLKRHLNLIAAAFRRPNARLALPYSINGLWKADLFLGRPDTDYWVGTTVKINPKDLHGADGLRIGIIPTLQGKSDAVVRDETKNLIVCPLPYDGEFMQIFYEGWEIVQSFIQSDARVPREVDLPRPDHRRVARYLEDRRDFPVVDVVDALQKIAQPHLLSTSGKTVKVDNQRKQSEIRGVIAPIALRK